MVAGFFEYPLNQFRNGFFFFNLLKFPQGYSDMKSSLLDFQYAVSSSNVDSVSGLEDLP